MPGKPVFLKTRLATANKSRVSNGPKLTGLFFRVDNFATIIGRKACGMSNVSEFCADKD